MSDTPDSLRRFVVAAGVARRRAADVRAIVSPHVGSHLRVLAAMICGGLLAARPALLAEHVPMGVVLRDETSADAFTVVNQGKEPLLVALAEASCDCLTMDSLPLVVAPGETRRLPFHYRSSVTGGFAVDVKLLGPDGVTVVDRHSVAGFVADRSWFVDVGAARALAKAGGVVFVDVRTAAKFSAAHIPRSLNLPAFALKARAAWRQQSLVLVDEGFAPDAMFALVAELRAIGFASVRVLDGGLPAWIRGDGAVEGTSTSALVAAHVTAAEFARAASTAEWRVFDLSEASRETIPGIVAVARPEDLVAALGAETRDAAGRVTPSVLVIAPDDATHARVEALAAMRPAARIYFLAGGRAALDRFVQEQLALATNDRPLLFVHSRQATRPAGNCAPCGR